MFDDQVFDKRIVEYWNRFNLTEKDFYCRECGKLMLDFSDIQNVGYNPTCKNIRDMLYLNNQKTIKYAESDANRWLVRGKIMSGKVYFRHLCWDCFFKHIGEIEDIPRRARKSSWYKDVNNGIFRPPASSASPSKYFKLLFDITDEELNNERKNFDTASLESFIRRHGEEEGTRKYEEYKKRQAYTCSKEYMMNERGMTEDEWNDFNANRACTKKNFIKRYGEELGTKKWEEYCETESYVGCKLEYFIEVYGKKEGTKKYLEVNQLKYPSLDNFIRRHGEEEGKARWERMVHKPYSKVSQKLFRAIDKNIGYYAKKNSEFFEKNGERIIQSEEYHRNIYPDYILGDKIIEFNGDYWHCNPKIYNGDDEVNFYGVMKLAKCVWEENKERYDILKSLGYKVKVVWENDYVHNPEKVLEECVQFLKT